MKKFTAYFSTATKVGWIDLHADNLDAAELQAANLISSHSFLNLDGGDNRDGKFFLKTESIEWFSVEEDT